MIKEFKEFAFKGSVADMAVGIMIGAAFGAVVNSAVSDILTPIVSGVFKAKDFSNMFIVLTNPTGESFATVEEATRAGAAVLSYGKFLNALISFLIVAFVLFLFVKGLNALRRKEEAAPPPPPGPTREEELLADIRDLLRKG